MLGLSENSGAFWEGSAEDALLVMLGVLLAMLVMLAVFGCLVAFESGY